MNIDDAVQPENLPATGKKRRPEWLTRNLFTLSWVSFLQDAASEMLYPILPIFLTTVLGAPAAIVGAIEGAAEGTAAATKLASAWLNRFMPRKLMVLLGYSGAALGKILVALAGIWPIVLTGRVVDRLGKGMRSASRDSLLVQGVSSGARGRVIGFHRSADTFGAVLGPLLALGLLAVFNNEIRPVLWVAVIPAVLSTLLVLLVRDDQPRQPKLVVGAPDGKGKLVKPTSPMSANLRTALSVIVGFSMINFPDALLVLHLSQIGFTLSEVIGAYLIFNISYALLNFPAGLLSDRFKPNQIYAIGMLLFAIAYGGMALTSDPTLSIALMVVYGAYSAVNDTVGKSWISKLAPDDRQMWAQSLLQGFSGFAILFAGIWAGLAWTLGAGAGVIPLAVSGASALVFAVLMATRKF
jgi:MFS family permease